MPRRRSGDGSTGEWASAAGRTAGQASRGTRQAARQSEVRNPKSELPRPAFTLLEVLLSVAIMAAVLAAAYGVVTSTTAARDHAEALTDATSTAQAVAWIIRQDLRGMPAAREDVEVFRAAARTGAADGDLVAFTTLSDPWQGGSGLTVVAYRLRPNTDDRTLFDLWRSQTPWRPGAHATPATPAWQPLCRRLASLKLEYAAGAGGGFSTTWSVPTATPGAVRISIEMPADYGDKPLAFQTVVTVPTGGVARPRTTAPAASPGASASSDDAPPDAAPPETAPPDAAPPGEAP
jgi:type II secretion system protein J